MTIQNPKLLIFGLAIVVIASAVFALKSIVKPKVQGHILIQFVTAAEASRGRILKINDENGAAAEYKCGPADAAVAALTAVSDVRGSTMRLEAQTGVDENGSRYSVGLHKEGKFFFVTVHRGFSHIPRTVNVDLWFSAIRDDRVQTRTTYKLQFKRFAPPVRVISPLSGPKLVEAEKHAYAEYVVDRQSIVVDVAPRDHAGYVLLARSFQNDENIRISLAENPLAQGIYDDQSDAVLVELRSSRPTESWWNVSYKNAEIHIVDGHRVLWFPKTEATGLLNNETSSIHQTNTRPENTFTSEINISVSPRLRLRSPLDVLSLESISPSLEEMGLESLQVDVNSIGLHVVKKSNPGSKTKTIDKVPNLTLRFKAIGNATSLLATYALPIHRVQSVKPHFSELGW